MFHFAKRIKTLHLYSRKLVVPKFDKTFSSLFWNLKPVNFLFNGKQLLSRQILQVNFDKIEFYRRFVGLRNAMSNARQTF